MRTKGILDGVVWHEIRPDPKNRGRSGGDLSRRPWRPRSQHSRRSRPSHRNRGTRSRSPRRTSRRGSKPGSRRRRRPRFGALARPSRPARGIREPSDLPDKIPFGGYMYIPLDSKLETGHLIRRLTSGRSFVLNRARGRNGRRSARVSQNATRTIPRMKIAIARIRGKVTFSFNTAKATRAVTTG